jgi:uncharacterized protein YkwD
MSNVRRVGHAFARWLALTVLSIAASTSPFAAQSPLEGVYLGDAPRRDVPQEASGAMRTLQPEAAPTRDNVVQLYKNVYIPGNSAALTWTGSIAGCNPGTTNLDHQQAVIGRVNYARALVGLPAVTVLGGTQMTQAQASALMMSANNSLSHFPPTNWLCYSADGASGAGSSNIALGTFGVEAIDIYLDDFGDNNTAAGHRRWILYPPQAAMATGDVSQTGNSNSASNDLYVFGPTTTRPPTPNGIAWPAAGYVPYPNLPAGSNRWSFSYPGADFSRATVTMSGPAGAIPVTLAAPENGYGDNTLIFLPTGVSYARPLADTTYHVVVSGMSGTNVPSSVQYDVTVIDPDSQSATSNVALASAGAVATASSTYSALYPATTINDNQRTGNFWVDGTYGAFPDWVQINFNGNKLIDHVVVYSLQDNFQSAAEPSDATTFTLYGITSFAVLGWDGSSWVTLGTVTDNSLVKRTVTFTAFTTDRIRINIVSASSPYSYLTEIEAWGTDVSTNIALASQGAVATASSSYGPSYPVTTVNDNQRTFGYWVDGTYGAFPDWVQINFTGNKTIDHVVVYTLQDNFAGPIEPADTTTFSLYGITDFTVQGWSGAAWITLGTVTGNNLVKRTVSFPAYATDRIRVNVNGARTGYSYINEIEAWTTGATPSPQSTNVALASAGAVATASSTYSGVYPASTVNDNQRAGNFWVDGTYGTFPDWVQINFSASKMIDRVVVYTLQDNFGSAGEPSDATSFSLYGITDFTVQGWNGSAWVTLGTVTGNNLVKRTVTFTAFATDRIRVNVNAARTGYSYITEIEAWGY